MPDPITNKIYTGAHRLSMDLARENMTRLFKIGQEIDREVDDKVEQVKRLRPRDIHLEEFLIDPNDLLDVDLVPQEHKVVEDDPVGFLNDVDLSPVVEYVEPEPEPIEEPEPVQEEPNLLNVDESNYTEEDVEPEEPAPVYYMREYEIEDTGERVKVKIDANKALDELDDDIQSFKTLKQAIKDNM